MLRFQAPANITLEMVDTSTEHPVTHGMGVVFSLIRLIVEERPLLFLGVPSLLFLLAGVGFGVWMLQIYAIEQYTRNKCCT